MRFQAGISAAVSGVWDYDICDSVFSGAYFRVILYPTGRGDPVRGTDSNGSDGICDSRIRGKFSISARTGDVAADQICDRVTANNVRCKLGGDNGEGAGTKIVSSVFAQGLRRDRSTRPAEIGFKLASFFMFLFSNITVYIHF